MDLYAIFRNGSTSPVWAGVTTQEEAEQKAIVAAVNNGNMELLNGPELVDRLGEGQGLIVAKPGPGVTGSRGETDEHGVMRWTRSPKGAL